MLEFNDMVTVVDQREREMREIEVLVRLVPFVERDVEERCAELEEEVLEDCERMKEREWERVFPELKAEAEEEGEDFPAGGGDAAWGAMNSKQ